MKHFLSEACSWGFFVLPLLVLGLRAFRPRLMPWWLLVLMVTLCGWLLVFGSIELHYAALGDDLQAYGEHPPPELSSEWAHDTGRPFARLFGWLYALLWLVPNVMLYGIFQLAHRWSIRRSA